MNGYTIQSKLLNKNKAFILQKSEIEKRLDPFYYFEILNNKLEFNCRVEKFSKVVKSYSGGTPSKEIPEYWNGEISWASPKDMKEFYLSGTEDKISELGLKNSASTLAPKGSVLIVFRSGILQHTLPLCITTENIAINQDLKVLIPSEDIIPEYLAVYLKSFQNRILPRIVKHSTTVQSINQEEFNSLSVPIPDKEIQKNIISINKKVVEQKKQNEAEAEKLLLSIDDYLLGELGIKMPVRPVNDLKNRIFNSSLSQISNTRFDPFFHQEYFNELLTSLENSKYLKSKLGFHISEITYGASFNNNYVESGVPLLRIKDLKRNEISVDEVVYLPESARKLLGNCFVKQNDFLISRSGTIGIVAIVPESLHGFAFGSFMIKFTLSENSDIVKEFLSYYLNSSIMIKLVERNKIGAVQGNITIPTIRNFPIVLPHPAKQQEIANHITAIRQQAQQLKDKTKLALEQANKEIEKILLG